MEGEVQRDGATVSDIAGGVPWLVEYYITNLAWWCAACAISFPILWATYHIVNRDRSIPLHEVITGIVMALFVRAATGYSLPTAPAFMLCAFYPSLLLQVSDVRLALILAGLGIILMFVNDVLRK